MASTGPGSAWKTGGGVAGEIAEILREDRKAEKRGRTPKQRILGVSLVIVTLAMAAAGLFVWHRGARLGSYVSLTIETSRGSFSVRVYPELAPRVVSQFLQLAELGFYDGLLWHRVDDWIVQTGDPATAGRVDTSAVMPPFEASTTLPNRRGTVGLARSQDPTSGTSQFYILKTDAPWLDSKYPVFGKVVSGMDVVDKLEPGDRVLRIILEGKR